MKTTISGWGLAALLSFAWGCSESTPTTDTGQSMSGQDAGTVADLGHSAKDASSQDQGFAEDAGQDMDAAVVDQGQSTDAASPDSGQADASTMDAGTPMADPCAPLPAPSGNIVRVTPAEAQRLPAIVRAAQSGTTILLADGNYSLRRAEGRLRFHVPGVTMRGESGDATKVIIDANYEVDELFYITVGDIVLADFTARRAIDHLLHITADRDATTNPTGVHLYRLRLFDSGEQFVKANSNGGDTAFPDQAKVECTYFELTDEGRPHIERNPGGCYTGGIDTHEGWGWEVRHNEFRDIYCAGEGLAEHAIHFWRGARDTLVENNLIVNCARGIGFGLQRMGAGRTYSPDPYPGVAPIGHFDGMIRNNVIYADIPWYDTGIELQQAHGAKVYHNTVVSSARATGFFSSIDYRFENTQVDIANNIARRISRRNGGNANLQSNLDGASLDLFVNPAQGDFHLKASAQDAIDQGVPLTGAGVDIDGERHNKGAAPDRGADER